MKDAVKAYLKSIGALYFMPVQFGYGADALDIIACWRGRYIEIETKVLPRQPTARQLRRIALVKEAGGTAFVAYSLDEVRGKIRCGTTKPVT